MNVKRFVPGFVCAFVSVALSAQTPIRWEPFNLRNAPSSLHAELGHLTVPLMRSNAAGGNAELAFVRIRSGAGKPASPIVYLAGGPGGSGMAAANGEQSVALMGRLAELGDIILLDQRGVGKSTPRAVCPPAAPLEPEQKFMDTAALVVHLTAATRACVDEWAKKGVDARAFTNRESAADLDDLRKALGASKLRLFGFSYGTHLALATLRNYGDVIESAVLIGTEGPNDTRKLPWSIDAQLAKLSMLAARDPSIGAEVPDMTALLRHVLDKLARQPIVVPVNDRLRKKEVQVAIGPDALRRILMIDIGDGNDFPVFPALLLTIDRGDPSILAWFAEKRYNQITGGVDLMPLGMECSSGVTANRQAEIDLEAKTSIFGDTMNLFYPAICSALPPVDLGDAFRGPLISDVPVLFISGTLDSNAPPYQAETLRFGMPRASHLIVDNAGHEDTLPNREVQQAMFDFFAGKSVGDRHIALPTPDFKSVEEAKKDRRR
jgi:pimeloyl-ACP methyl ester carboxylesterase